MNIVRRDEMYQKMTQLLASTAGNSTLMLRIPVGIIFMAHGSQKLFGLFGGGGLAGTGQFFESIGLAPGELMALLAGGAEFFGGLFLILGLLTRLSALALAFTMVVAIISVHLEHGLFLSNGGYEFALALLAATLSLLFSGSGKWALDRVLLNAMK